MATKKREIYARCAVQLRTHERAIRAEQLCAGAMGLYLFLLLHARGESSRGDVAVVVAEASWGGQAKYRRKQIDALVAVGLVERVDERLHVVKYDEHNDTPEDIAAARDAAKKRKASQRGHGHVTRDIDVSHAEVPISISYSLSESGSSGGPGGAIPPAWWANAIATAEGSLMRKVDEPAARWLEYVASRKRKGWAPSQGDAAAWLTTVLRNEARTAPPKRAASGAEATKQPYDENAPWMKVGA